MSEEQALPPVVNTCACGVEISKWSSRCAPCVIRVTIEKAKVVPYDEPFNIVGSDQFYTDLESALDDGHAGQFAHPCDQVPLSVNAKRMAVEMAERATEDMVEEAFEDAYSYVVGEDNLRAAIEVALIAFNEAQTANSWNPRTGEVFEIVDPDPSARLSATQGRE